MTPDGKREYRIQLVDSEMENIIAAGGKCFVATADRAVKATLYDSAGAALSNPITPTRGFLNFFVGVSIETVDLYIAAPGGQFRVAKGVAPGGPNEIQVDTASHDHTMVIPIAAADMTAAAENATGFVEPANSIIKPHPFIKVLAVDATETIEIGTDSGDSGDADGFLDAVSVAALGIVKGTIDQAGNTIGALFEVQDSANAGDLTHEAKVSGGKSITATPTAGSDTGELLFCLPYTIIP